jgi:hypothetical protein
MVAVLSQASIAVNVLVCERSQPLEVTAASREVTVGVPHPSVAEAEPSAAVIADEAGLQPSGTSAYDPVNTGGIRSLVQVTVLEVVAELPQASIAVNILVCERSQPLLVTAPSREVTVGVPHPSVAEAEPSEVLISVGLQPRLHYYSYR